MKYTAESMLKRLREGEDLSQKDQLSLIIRLALPAMLAQTASTVMQYIDASMVGRLGSQESAAIGLVASSTWLFLWTCTALSTGFTVQVAQLIGARRYKEARSVLLQSLVAVMFFSLAMVAVGLAVAPVLPGWLGGDTSLHSDAQAYFTIAILSIPFVSLNYLSNGMLQCSGNMRLPSLINIGSCVADVLFNLLFIFPSSSFLLLGKELVIPGLGLGVKGAALGTALASVCAALVSSVSVFVRSEILHIRAGDKLRLKAQVIETAARISAPLALENFVMSGALVITTKIVAPLGAASIAANSFSVTAESLCYMPGYGIGAAATTIVGQSIGAERRELSRKLAWHTTALGIAVMTAMGAFMFFFAPAMIGFLTPDPEIQALAVMVLRIEAFAEPLYAASIVASGSLRGAGDTFIPFLLNFLSLWLVRIPLSSVLASRLGLRGVWIAMCVELNIRGILMLLRLRSRGWSQRVLTESGSAQAVGGKDTEHSTHKSAEHLKDVADNQ